MRILSDTPNAMLGTIAEQVLGAPLWFTADAVAGMIGEAPTGPFVLYADEKHTVPIDLDATPRTKCIALTTDTGEVYRLVAFLRPAIGNYYTYLAADRRFILLLQTHAARHADGTVQIHGAEPGLMIFTVEKFREARRSDKTLIEGDVMKSFSVEELGPDGQWQAKPTPFVLPAGSYREISED